jgi:hypothetical protein
LSKFGNAASIYYLGSGKENYKNWGGWTKHGDTLAVTGELSNFGRIEDFLNNRLGITVPDIPLGPGKGQTTFYPPIKYTDTVFELRGSDATSLATTGFLDSSAAGFRGAAMQVMEGNRKGKTEFLLEGTSFVKFVNQQKGSAANDVADFLVDTAGDIGGSILDLASDAGSSVVSGVSGLVSSISVSIPKPSLPTIPSPITFIKGLKAPDVSSLFDVDFPKITAPSVDLPSLKSMGAGLSKFISKAGDLLPDIDIPKGAGKFELGEGGQKIANAFSSVSSKLAGLVPDIPISFPKISIKPSSELLDYINDIKNGTTALARREKRELIEFSSRVINTTARNFKSAKDRTQRFIEEVQHNTAHNYQDLEKKLKSATSPRIPGYGEGGGSALADKNPRSLQISKLSAGQSSNTYSQLGSLINKSSEPGTPGEGSYERELKYEESTGASEGDPLNKKVGFDSTLVSVENPRSIASKHVENDSGNIWSGFNKQLPSPGVPADDKYEQKLGREESMGVSEGDPLNKKVGFNSTLVSVENPESIVTKQLNNLVTPYSGLDLDYKKYSSNVNTLHKHETDGDVQKVAGGFYQSVVGNTADTGDLHTALPMKTGASLSEAGEDYKKDVELEKNGMPFYFKDLRDNKYVIFRGYVESLTENLNPSWNSHNYIGRSEPVWTYSRTERDINFVFKVFAGNDEELKFMYEKINMLSSMVYPWYRKDKGLNNKNRMKPPYTSLRLGELFGNENHNMTGYIKSLVYTWPDNSPWETKQGKRVPKHIIVTIGFQVVHRDPPDRDTQSTHFHGFLTS